MLLPVATFWHSLMPATIILKTPLQNKFATPGRPRCCLQARTFCHFTFACSTCYLHLSLVSLLCIVGSSQDTCVYFTIPVWDRDRHAHAHACMPTPFSPSPMSSHHAGLDCVAMPVASSNNVRVVWDWRAFSPSLQLLLCLHVQHYCLYMIWEEVYKT